MDKGTIRDMKEGVMITKRRRQNTRKERSNGMGRLKQIGHYIRSCIVLFCLYPHFLGRSGSFYGILQCIGMMGKEERKGVSLVDIHVILGMKIVTIWKTDLETF